jgi:DNA topoisomerase-1
MGKILFIVESKVKVHSISKILGSDYQVEASIGHVRDLKKKGLSINLETFEGDYEITKPDIVRHLQDVRKKCDSVIIASDQDYEGEQIGLSLALLLKVDPESNCRVTYTEITSAAIKAAIKNPVPIDFNKVGAQQLRRFLDRIAGYGLSSLVIAKIPGAMSAGRVQSAALRWICDKQRERDAFLEAGSDSYYRVKGIFQYKDKYPLKTVLYEIQEKKKKGKGKNNGDTDEPDNNDISEKDAVDAEEDAVEENTDPMLGTRKVAKLAQNVKPDDTSEISKFMEQCKKSTWQVADTRDSKSTRHPPPPFMTSSIQTTAAAALGMPVKKTMSTLQSLFERGFITYPRTDSIILSKTALDGISQYIKDNFEKKYYQPRVYKDKKSSTQGAHECIRVTDYEKPEISDLGKDEQKLYNMIWRRTIASQMASATFDVTTVDINSANQKLPSNYLFITRLEQMTFDGYLRVYNYRVSLTNGNNEDDDSLQLEKGDKMPTLKKGHGIERDTIEAKLEFSPPPGLPTEASLVRSLKNLGIGRPSTYASIIDKVLSREYASITDLEGDEMQSRILTLTGKEKKAVIQEETKKVMVGAQKKCIVPSAMGMRVTEFLEQYFPKVVDYKFTAQTEEQMDAVAEGTKDWKKCLRKFCDWFDPEVQKIKLRLKEEKKDRPEGEIPYDRIVGKLPDGRQIYAKLTRHGPAIFVVEADGKPRYANLGKLKLEKVTEEQAIKLLSIPKNLGEYHGDDIILRDGKFGFYITCGKVTASIPKDMDPYEITKLVAKDLLKAAQKMRAEKYLKELEDDDFKYTVMKKDRGEDKGPSYFVMIAPKKKEEVKPLTTEGDTSADEKEEKEEDKGKKKKDKPKLSKEEKAAQKEEAKKAKEAAKLAKEAAKLAKAKGKKPRNGVEFVGIGDRDPQSITIPIIKELLKEKASKAPSWKNKKQDTSKKEEATSDQKGGISGKRGSGKGYKKRTSKRKSSTGKNKKMSSTSSSFSSKKNTSRKGSTSTTSTARGKTHKKKKMPAFSSNESSKNFQKRPSKRSADSIKSTRSDYSSKKKKKTKKHTSSKKK